MFDSWITSLESNFNTKFVIAKYIYYFIHCIGIFYFNTKFVIAKSKEFEESEDGKLFQYKICYSKIKKAKC